jgi:sugar (pentulose or hexulose) kinase
MAVAVLDIGKTNLKLLLIENGREILAQRSVPNRALPGPPWLHVDLEAIERWLLASLGELAGVAPLEAFVAAGHGSGGVLVDESGPVLPPIDYDEQPPPEIMAEHERLAPPYLERGSPHLAGASHLVRQLIWAERRFPERVAAARWLLPFPQYWAWRLGGRAVGEVSMLGAQSQLWSPLDGRFTALAESSGWRRLVPPIVPAWEVVGHLRPDVARATGLPVGMAVLAGVHDSTANLYRYQEAGLGDATLLSTGTWIVGMSGTAGADRLDEARGMTVTSDVRGRPVVGLLAMTGREHARIRGDAEGAATVEALARVIAGGTLALPGFCEFDGIFPGSAGRGRLIGAAPSAPPLRVALATLYAALVGEVCLDLLGAGGTVVVDGGFATDPAFAGILAALRPEQTVLVEKAGGGTAFGGALLWTHERRTGPVPLALALTPAPAVALPGLCAYRARWREAVRSHLDRSLPPPTSPTGDPP